MTAKYNRQWLVENLRRNELVVTFTKVDNTTRKMRCTLQPSYLPEDFRNKGELLQEVEGNTIAVWDVDMGAWRSFRVDSVTNVE